ncbi:Sec23-binding domain of Sec16-domain-containing protein [Mucor mucedo]|uniref:Sec23-binding domain of Sec16-domain-containing protein n=1 Tax=Mucor mucedo TaxID=29922 RepID=UPI00221EB8B0|nr:Sec23-binding domain of Sec16-domain-containing protein [Mucor mucedo]KAI7889323.1 Sec23-binding domain of Sec16-domain-containing protein [Mucor mucedo]
MTSHKEEPNPSILFGDSAGDDPFSQMLQQNSVSELPPAPVGKAVVTEQKKTPTTANVQPLADASSLFATPSGTANTDAADIFFSSPQPKTTTATTTTSTHSQNASAANFFEQQPSESFFDGLAQPEVHNPPVSSTASLTQAFDPNAYSATDYSQPQEAYDQQAVEYDPNQWIQFDPNVHYYYDEQSQLHYYDPNTNQEYDMSQYTYDDQGQPYDYQYDPQYAEYYAQQAYDPATTVEPTADNNAAAAAAVTGGTYAPEPASSGAMAGYTDGTSHDQQVYTQDNYDPNAYAPVPESQGYSQEDFFHSQVYNNNNNNNAVAEVPAQIQSEQTIDTQHQAYPQDDYAPVTAVTQIEGEDYESTHHHYGTQDYTPSDFFAEDLQQEQALPPPPKANPPPPSKAMSMPPPSGPPQSISLPPKSNSVNDASSEENKQPTITTQHEADGLQEVHDDQPTDDVDLNDLDHMVLSSFNKDEHLYEAEDELDRLVSASSKKDPVYNNPNEYEEPSDLHVETHPHVEETVLSSYEPQQDDKSSDHHADQAFQYAPPQETNVYAPLQDVYAPQKDAYAPQQDAYVPQEDAYAPQQDAYVPQKDVYAPQQDAYAPQQDAYAPQQDAYAPQHDAYAPQQDDYAPQQDAYAPQQDAYAPQKDAYVPQSSDQVVDYSSSYTPQPTDVYTPQQHDRSMHAPPKTEPAHEPSTQPTAIVEKPPTTQRSMKTPSYAPPRSMSTVSHPQTSPLMSRKSMTSPPPPVAAGMNAMQAFTQQRSNSITEPDRKQNGSPFTGYPYSIERSATVPPPMTERIASPRPMLTACPDPQCEGENKAKAKFCCECGRPLAGISRSTTPSAGLSPGVFTMSETNQVVPRTALDEKKDTMRESLKKFISHSILSHHTQEDKQQFALQYMDSRISEFHDEKALVWNIVKLMIQHQDQTLGDGGQLDKSIAQLLVTPTPLDDASLPLDQLEHYLLQGDREGACQFATEHDLWAHALLISQSQGPDHFKQLISKFIDRELFASTESTLTHLPADKKELRMLYSIFSGAGADAVSQLTRNSVTDHPATHFSEDSLPDWKKALSLILLNRSSNDSEAISELGHQLKTAGFPTNAFICYMLSPDTIKGLGGIFSTEDKTDLDALYLTEFYEYACKIQLPQYKLMLAWWLIELDMTQEAAIYSDALADSLTLEEITGFNEIRDTVTDSSVTSLLNKATFDSLIKTITDKIQSRHPDPTYLGTSSYAYDDTTGQVTSDQQVDNGFNYGYSYGGGYTEPDHTSYAPSPSQAEGIQSSPFQNSAVTSPFQQQQQQQPFTHTGVHSPFQHHHHQEGYTPSQSHTTHWDTVETKEEQPAYQPYQHETPTSYEPDAYTPSTTHNNTTWDDDDDLGFGNSKKKADKVTEGSTAREEKPNEVEEKKEEKSATAAPSGGWGIFSLFGGGRKEKEQTSEEKKAVKANLGEQSSFYYDEKEKRWVNKLNDAKPETTATPPPPKSATPQPSFPTNTPPPPPASAAAMMTPPTSAGLKPASMPPVRISSTPNVPSTGGPPNAAPPSFSTPPATRRSGGARKSMRSRYVDVLNTTT